MAIKQCGHSVSESAIHNILNDTRIISCGKTQVGSVYRNTYSAQEARNAVLAWIEKDKSNRKAPKKDYGRFLNSWLGRAEPAGKTTKQQGDDSIGYLLYKLEHIEAKHGEDVARRYDAKARELNSTIKADEWLKREIECRTSCTFWIRTGRTRTTAWRLPGCFGNGMRGRFWPGNWN